MKNTFKLLLNIGLLIGAWHVFQWNTFLNYTNWYLAILKAKMYTRLYRTQFFIIAKDKHSLAVVNYLFVGRYNALRKSLKLTDKGKFTQFKMKKISVNTLQDKCYYKTSLS
jgi:hypothetical protein